MEDPESHTLPISAAIIYCNSILGQFLVLQKNIIFLLLNLGKDIFFQLALQDTELTTRQIRNAGKMIFFYFFYYKYLDFNYITLKNVMSFP